MRGRKGNRQGFPLMEDRECLAEEHMAKTGPKKFSAHKGLPKAERVGGFWLGFGGVWGVVFLVWLLGGAPEIRGPGEQGGPPGPHWTNGCCTETKSVHKTRIIRSQTRGMTTT